MTTKTAAAQAPALPLVKPRRTTAILKKQLRDTLKNKTVLIQFIIFPLIAFIFTELVGKNMGDMGGVGGTPHTMFGTMFATMYAGMVPMITAASIIAEEKETNTLKVLMMAGVKNWQYLLGTGLYIVGMTMLGALAFGLMCGHSGTALAIFLLGMLASILCSLLLGYAVGLFSRNQMGANTLVMPVAMVAAFLPLIGMFNEKLATAARLLYTQQTSNLLENPAAGVTGGQLAIMGGNFVVFLAIFILAYRREGRAK